MFAYVVSNLTMFWNTKHWRHLWWLHVVVQVWHILFLSMKQWSRVSKLFAVNQMILQRARQFWSLPGCLSALRLADL